MPQGIGVVSHLTVQLITEVGYSAQKGIGSRVHRGRNATSAGTHLLGTILFWCLIRRLEGAFVQHSLLLFSVREVTCAASPQTAPSMSALF